MLTKNLSRIAFTKTTSRKFENRRKIVTRTLEKRTGFARNVNLAFTRPRSEFWGQTLFSVFKNVASEAFGVRYPHSVSNLIRPAEAAIDQSANVAIPIKHPDALLSETENRV